MNFDFEPTVLGITVLVISVAEINEALQSLLFGGVLGLIHPKKRFPFLISAGCKEPRDRISIALL